VRSNISQLNLVDLISEKHLALRKKVTDMSHDEMNRTEAHILVMLEEYGRLSVSELSKIIQISRQGTHKCVQRLIKEGYLELADAEGNLRDKPITLTEKGHLCCKQMLEIKTHIEQEIMKKIGPEQVVFLRKLLSEDWLDS
jgi:DNA-binding MarR family transcriptional regulator